MNVVSLLGLGSRAWFVSILGHGSPGYDRVDSGNGASGLENVTMSCTLTAHVSFRNVISTYSPIHVNTPWHRQPQTAWLHHHWKTTPEGSRVSAAINTNVTWTDYQENNVDLLTDRVTLSSTHVALSTPKLPWFSRVLKGKCPKLCWHLRLWACSPGDEHR